jgi:hypothetical protein
MRAFNGGITFKIGGRRGCLLLVGELPVPPFDFALFSMGDTLIDLFLGEGSHLLVDDLLVRCSGRRRRQGNSQSSRGGRDKFAILVARMFTPNEADELVFKFVIDGDSVVKVVGSNDEGTLVTDESTTLFLVRTRQKSDVIKHLNLGSLIDEQ